ncbi:MAG: Gfo/Idh/MocA family oxidoreductase [Clostridiales bacterium]|nr:Gfo/Idh/MocA family oxidoreductase [Clostridiales bacterium]
MSQTKKRTRIGIFGTWRGSSFISNCEAMTDDFELVALCDKNEKTLNDALSRVKGEVKTFSDFDEFIECGLDAVILANYFHEHAPYAIRCLERGIHVFSECTSASTLAECTALCDAAEKSDAVYMIAENYPFSAANLELQRLAMSGKLGKILYGEGEYNHGCDRETLRRLTPGKYHWRGWMPRTYYCTHALGPLMHMTGAMPVKVSARAVHSDVLETYDDFRHNYDAYAMMDVSMDDGSMFNVTGCAAIPSPSRYRIVGEYGSAETGGHLDGKVRKYYYPWETPEGESNDFYAPEWPFNAEMASAAGHGGGDFWTLWNFAHAIKKKEQPFFDVYRGCAMSAVGILGWKSCLNDGATYLIPDFRDKSERDRLAEQYAGFYTATPFPDSEGRGATLPPAVGRRPCDE